MSQEERGELIVGLDIGTTKICAAVGETRGNQVDIIGLGTHPSIGLKKGVVVNIESTVDSIRHAVDKAEEAAGCEVHNVCVGIAGSHIKGFNSPGIVGIKNREIRQDDIDRVAFGFTGRIAAAAGKVLQRGAKRSLVISRKLFRRIHGSKIDML